MEPTLTSRAAAQSMSILPNPGKGITLLRLVSYLSAEKNSALLQLD